MKILLQILIVFIILSAFSYALDCQYTTQTGFIQVSKLYVDNVLQETPVEVRNFRTNGCSINQCLYLFDVYDFLDVPVNVTVQFWGSGSPISQESEIQPHTTNTFGGYIGISQDTIKFVYNTNNYSEARFVNEAVYGCKECPVGSGLTCINDEQPSDSDTRCGSGKRINGTCQSKYIVGDGVCSIDLFGEDCSNSKKDCACNSNMKCNDDGKCVADPLNPPKGKEYCNGEFLDIKVKDKDLFCNCNFECKDHLTCRGTCVDDCSNPPSGMDCCNGAFKNVQAINLENKCSCDFECKEGVCLNEKCQYILNPKLTCKSGTEVKKGEELYCNLVVRNTILNTDIKASLVLDAGNGLAFSSSDGCQNVKGSQCIGTFSIADLSNDGVEVRLQALADGDTKISGVVTFPYKSKTIKETVSDIKVHVFYCGDGKVDTGETKETCCSDTGIEQYTFFNFFNEKCENNKLIHNLNWIFIIMLIGIVVLFGVIILLLSTNHVKEIRKKEYAKQKTLQIHIEHEIKKLYVKNTELEKIKQEIEEIKIHKNIEETERDRLNKLKEDKNLLLNEIESIEQNIDSKWENLKPFPDEQARNRLVIINPYLGGYKCFFKKELELKEYPTSSLVHRWVWKEHTGNWPRRGYHIHHIDGNKYNNNIKNLEEIDGEEHYEKHRRA